MKNLAKILLILMAIIPLAISANDDEVSEPSVINEINNQDADGEARVIQVLNSIPGAKAQYDKCVEAGAGPGELDDCLWNGGKFSNPNGGAEVKIDPLSPDIRKEVQEKLYADKDRAHDLEIDTAKENESPAIQKLKKYFEEKLTKHLYGDQPKLKAVDHKVFTDLFRAQLGKNLISAMSSYCIDADKGEGFLLKKDDDDRDKVRKKNMDSLSVQNGKKIEAYDSWSNCIVAIQHICHRNNEDVNGFNYCDEGASGSSGKACETACKGSKCISKGMCGSTSSCDDDDVEYSQGRACTVTAYLKKVRSNLLALDTLDKGWEKIASDPNRSKLRAEMGTVDDDGNFQALDVKQYSGKGEDEKTIDQLVSMSSNEAINESGYEEGMQEQEEKFKECMGEDDKIKNVEVCKQFLSTNHDKTKELVGEYSLRSRGIAQKLEDGKDSTPEDDEKLVTEILKEEGFTDEQIEKELENATSASDLKAKIRSRYQAQRKAIVAKYAKELEGKTSTKDGEITDKDVEKLQNIRKELTSNAKRYKELVHFNNIVSGYLTFGEKTDADGNPVRNTASIKLELDDSAYSQNANDNRGDGRNPANNGDAAADAKRLEQVRAAVENSGIDLTDEGDNGVENSSVGKEELNSEILYYSKDKDTGSTP